VGATDLDGRLGGPLELAVVLDLLLQSLDLL
jgi:hypothetical protein